MERSKPRILRRLPAILRVGIAVLVLALFVYAYLSNASYINANGILSLAMKGQFSPALYGTGIAAFAVICGIVTALLFGRVYCSVLCPLGTLQELFWRAGNFLRGLWGTRHTGKHEKRSIPKNQKTQKIRGYRAAPGIRYVVLLLTGLGLAFAFSPLMMVLDPVSNFGRGMGALRAIFAENTVSFSFALALGLPFAAIMVLAFLRGRVFCDWCPVGQTLGLFSSTALFGAEIDSRCVSCGICEKACPTACIDAHRKRIDSERCVLCLSCVSVCPGGNARYGLRHKAARVGESRRVFLKGAGRASLFCGAVYLLGPSLKLFSSGQALIKTAGTKRSVFPILPPGALNEGHYYARCIGCQACIAACPVRIITASGSPCPTLDYTEAGCQYNCIECGRVCPTGAIRRLDVEEKHRTRIALSTLYFERCVVKARLESCGACAEVCPTGAVTMTAYGESGVPWLTRPVFDERYCIGCGACLAACPAEPRAFSLDAVPEQTLTEGVRPAEESDEGFRLEATDDFPF